MVKEQFFSANEKFFCNCCGYNTLMQFRDGTYEVCEICYWEDDKTQTDNPDYVSGANKISLNEARKNYEQSGASDLTLLQYVRKASANDIRNNNS
ncbi:CPCC family cysteine-rich protein [Gynurincola endophyticus]|uniref:CPCC family cysteine-rich protein n=1 Tax=Gynurincola endophyticus TaxID=2479004 RepID=UPI000F8CA0EA|nr:CPCC family cysteine-rich protein [Gynurincola endophyticus]